MGRTVGYESRWLYPWRLIRLPLADGKLIIDKPINDRRRRKRGGCGKSLRAFWHGGFFHQFPAVSFCARTTTYYDILRAQKYFRFNIYLKRGLTF